MRLNGDAIDEADERGERVVGDTLLILMNADERGDLFVLPATASTERWETLIDTADPWRPARRLRAGDRYELQGRSMAVLKLSGREDRNGAMEWGPAGTH
jgi:glycogen operon protein